MAWELYNKEKHGTLTKKTTCRIAGWKHITTLAGCAYDDNCAKIGGRWNIKFTSVAKLRKTAIIRGCKIGDDGIWYPNFDGWSYFTLPFSCIEVYTDGEAAKMDYNRIGWSRCDNTTILMPGDFVRTIQVSQMTSEYNAKISRQADIRVGDLHTPILDVTNKSVLAVSKGCWKKMRKGQIVAKPTIFNDSNHIFLDGTYGDQFKVPYIYLEVQFDQKYSKADREASAGLKQKLTTKTETKTESKNPIKEETTMNLTANFNAKEMMDQNKDALLVAAKIEVGEVAVQQVSKIVKSRLPFMMKGYAELPVFDIVLANLVVMSIKQFAPDNEKAQIIADAMLLAAMQKQLKEFNIPAMVDEFVAGIDVSSITKLEAPKAN